MIDDKKLVEQLKTRATKLGFDSFGICSAKKNPLLEKQLNQAIKNGWYGDMDWLADSAKRRANPQELWHDAKSIIMVGISYAPSKNPLLFLDEKSKGNISVYAKNRDYHDIIKGRLKELAGLLARKTNGDVKVFVDTAPVMEKPLAQAAGLGWQGKHSVVVSRDFGSWLFLGAIFSDIELPNSNPQKQLCGSCTKCLDICPTFAFPKAFQLDATKCLAYYNNEHKGHIPLEFRAPMGNRIFGCDDCLAICPWNKFAKKTSEIKLQAREELEKPALIDLIKLDDIKFRKLFAGSPVKRLGVIRFIRNVLIAVGNSRDKNLLDAVEKRLSDNEPLIRAMAIWAFIKLANEEEIEEQRKKFLPKEKDEIVAKEWGVKL